MKLHRVGLKCVAIFVSFLGSAPVALAVDGVILIDQNRALAGNVTAGDGAGFPVMINQPGSYRLSGNLTVPIGMNGIEINADNVTLDLNGFSITGPGAFPNLGIGIVSTDHQRMAIGNGSISGFVIGLRLAGDSRLMRLEKLQIDATTRTAANGRVGGVAAILGVNRASHAVVNEVQAVGQIQITCPGLVRNTAADIVETRVPPDGTGVGFPTNCRGENVVTGPFQ
jgi:hypothetical protein